MNVICLWMELSTFATYPNSCPASVGEDGGDNLAQTQIEHVSQITTVQQVGVPLCQEPV